MSAQGTVGPRLYLRFEDNKGDLYNYIGMRIRPNFSRDNYWVLGGAYGNPSTNPNPIGLAYLPSPLTGTLPPLHKHIATTGSNNGIIGFGADFSVLDNDNATIICHHKKVNTPPPPSAATSLFTVNTNINVVANSSDYDMNNYTNTWGPFKPNFTTGNSMVYDRVNDTYYCAFHAIDPATVGNGTNLSDWGMMAVDDNTFNTDWQFVFVGTDAMQDERVHCMLQDGEDLVVVGSRRDFTNQQYGGLVTKVDRATGTLIYQFQYNPPTGYRVEFNCISAVEKPLLYEYIVTGTIFNLTNPLAPTRMLVLAIDPGTGAVVWSKQYSMTNGDDIWAYHHYTDVAMTHAITVAGTVYRRSAGHTSGFLMELLNPTLTGISDCDSLIVWQRTYDTRNADGKFVNTSLVDVTRSLNTSANPHDFTAVGTAEVIHAGQQITDVLVLETEYDPVNGTIGHSYSGGNDPVTDYCLDDTLLLDCDDYPLDTLQLFPSQSDTLEKRNTPLTSVTDTTYRECDNGNHYMDLQDGVSQKRSADLIPQLTQYTHFTNRNIVVQPIPVTSNKAEIGVYIQYPGSVELRIFDLLGSQLKSFPLHFIQQGKYSYSFDCSELNNTMYCIQLITEYNTSSVVFPVLK
ncbi:MAG: hypothetical protein U0Y96_08815 [Candidatus Kapaibacterium sp.]